MKKNNILNIFLVLIICFSVGFDVFAEEDLVEKDRGVMVLSLDESIKYAALNSFEVKIAKLDYYIADTQNMYAEAVFDTFLFGGANYAEDKRQQAMIFFPDNSQKNVYYGGISKTLPTGTQLKAELSDTRDWSNTTFTSKNPYHNTEFAFEARQPIGKNAFGYMDRKTITVTRLAVENADLETQDRISDFIANVEKSYWELVFRKKALDIYLDIYDKAKKLNDSNIKNFKVGLIEQVDMYASEANIARIKAELLIVKNDYKRAQENLKLIMNMPDDITVEPGRDLHFEGKTVPLEDCLKTAFDQRRDYQMTKTDVEIQGINVKIKGNAKWPVIDLVGTWAFNGLEPQFEKAWDKATGADHSYYYAGIEVNLPIENKQARSEYKKAQFEKEKAILKMKDVERKIITEVGNTYGDVIAYEQSIPYMVAAVNLQKEKLAEEAKRFNYGRSNTKRIIDYQNDLLTAQREETEYLYKYKAAAVDLDKAMNVILSKYKDLL